MRERNEFQRSSWCRDQARGSFRTRAIRPMGRRPPTGVVDWEVPQGLKVALVRDTYATHGRTGNKE